MRAQSRRWDQTTTEDKRFREALRDLHMNLDGCFKAPELTPRFGIAGRFSLRERRPSVRNNKIAAVARWKFSCSEIVALNDSQLSGVSDVVFEVAADHTVNSKRVNTGLQR